MKVISSILLDANISDFFPKSVLLPVHSEMDKVEIFLIARFPSAKGFQLAVSVSWPKCLYFSLGYIGSRELLLSVPG